MFNWELRKKNRKYEPSYFVIGSTSTEFVLGSLLTQKFTYCWKVPNGAKDRTGAEKPFGEAKNRAGAKATGLPATGVSVNRKIK